MQFGQGLPTTGIPAVDALLAKLPEEVARFQQVPQRLSDVRDQLERLPPARATAATPILRRVSSAQATYAGLAAKVGTLIRAYGERRPLTTYEIAQAATIAVGVPALHQVVRSIEHDAAVLEGGSAVMRPGPLPGVVVGGALGFLLFGVVGALVGALAGAYVVKGD